MYLLRIAPLTTIPLPHEQVLDYFSSRDLPPGALVEVALNRRKVVGVVLGSALLAAMKARLRKGVPYQVSRIGRVVSAEPVLTTQQLELAHWMAKCFWAPLGKVFRAMLPMFLLKRPAVVGVRARPVRAGRSFAGLVWQADRRREYVSVIAAVLARGEQVLFLTPDSAAQTHWEQALAAENVPWIRYGAGLGSRALRAAWKEIASGGALVVIGARSAVFAPFGALGLVIVEDEESDAHKSWAQSPRFDAREAAEKLAELHDAKLVFGSTSPTLAIQLRARRGRLKLTGPDPTAARALAAEMVDMRAERRERHGSPLSRQLQGAVGSALAEGRQVILFINRRGTAPVLICRDCGVAVECPRCSASLVQHRGAVRGRAAGNVLVCHHCDWRAAVPDVCPACRGHDLRAFGAGTELVEAEARKLWPDAAVARLDADVAPTGRAAAGTVAAFAAGNTQILVATQRALALRFHAFLKPPLFGIVALDPLLAFPDYRVAERLWQVVRSLGLNAARTVIQTYRPDQPFLEALQGPPAAFYAAELASRKALGFPPFSELVKLTFRHRDARAAHVEAAALAERLTAVIAKAKAGERVSLLGPAPAFIVRERGQFVWNVVVQSRLTSLSARNRLLAFVPSDWAVDVHPESIL